jgi:hypothetical protein
MPYRAIFAYKICIIIFNSLLIAQAIHDISDGGFTGMKFSYMSPDVFFFSIAQQPEFCKICPNNDTVGIYPMQADGGIVKVIFKGPFCSVFFCYIRAMENETFNLFLFIKIR